MRSEARIAFVTDALPGLGGAERTLFAALECFPQADVFTLVYNKPAFAQTPLAGRHVRTSFIDRLPHARENHRWYLPLMPAAVERIDLRGYDIVVSFSYAVAHGAKAPAAKHLSYTYTPMRYAWNDLNVRGQSSGNNALISRYFEAFRNWDRRAVSRVQGFATISEDIARRIQASYAREARVIYPPVEVRRFVASPRRENYYAVVSRLVAHKRIDLIVEAFAALKLPLKIIGEGPEKARLMSGTPENIQFLGFQSDAVVVDVLSRARGFVCAAEEDFGIAMVEAQAAGCPVIAYGRGGALETVVQGSTGLFFTEQSADSIVDAVCTFERQASTMDPQHIAAHAARYDKHIFQREFSRFVNEA